MAKKARTKAKRGKSARVGEIQPDPRSADLTLEIRRASQEKLAKAWGRVNTAEIEDRLKDWPAGDEPLLFGGQAGENALELIYKFTRNVAKGAVGFMPMGGDRWPPDKVSEEAEKFKVELRCEARNREGDTVEPLVEAFECAVSLWLNEIALRSPLSRLLTAEAATIHLDDVETYVLSCAYDKAPQITHQQDVTERGRGAVSKAVDRLKKVGLLSEPPGKSKGFVLTSRGRAFFVEHFT